MITPGSEPVAGAEAKAVAAVVVNYNAAEHLRACLRSLEAAGAGEIVVVDNGSSDASAAVVAELGEEAAIPLRWLPAGANLGYGRAANLGASVTAAPYLMVCNPDVVVEADTLSRLVGALVADAAAAVVAPLLRNSDGSVYPSARTFPDLAVAAGHGLLGFVAPDNRFTRRYRLLDWDHREAAAVDWVSGACFLARREAWERVGGFDDAYFMYLEDVDLCWRLGRAGWTVRYEPSAEALHVQGVSSRLHPYRMLAAHHRSLWRFARRSTTGLRRMALPLVAVGLVGRLILAMVDHRLGSTRSSRAARIA